MVSSFSFGLATVSMSLSYIHMAHSFLETCLIKHFPSTDSRRAVTKEYAFSTGKLLRGLPENILVRCLHRDRT